MLNIHPVSLFCDNDISVSFFTRDVLYLMCMDKLDAPICRKIACDDITNGARGAGLLSGSWIHSSHSSSAVTFLLTILFTIVVHITFIVA